MSKRVVVIGAGINGLVAAFYLRRAGLEVTLLEKKNKIGGACTFETLTHEEKEYPYPSGASVFGMMQDFIFTDTGLDKRVSVYRPDHPALVYFGGEEEPFYAYEDSERYAEEAKKKWNEKGKIRDWDRDLEKVRAFLLQGYREAKPPDLDDAKAALGESLANRWIRGSARSLFSHYFTSDRMKIYKSMAVTESGPVPLDGPSTAFNVAVMNGGSVFDGRWGFVKGRLYSLLLELGDILKENGVTIVTEAGIEAVNGETGAVRYQKNGASTTETFEAIFLASDPVSAAELLGKKSFTDEVKAKHFLGSSGKMVLFFKEPIQWKGDKGEKDFDGAFRYFYSMDTLKEFEQSNTAARGNSLDYSPSCLQIYCEGANMRKLGWKADYDSITVFVKDLTLSKRGKDQAMTKAAVENAVLQRLENPETFFLSVLVAPKDLQEMFFFPGGNIDHMELREGQNFSERTFSKRPKDSFYAFGEFSKAYYCGAGSYPCGSVSGTAGYLCATQYLRKG